jgi:hypothetical protein
MGLFDIFKKSEDIYYRKYKKVLYTLDKDKPITISLLRTRVMTIERTINNIKKDGLEKLSAPELKDINLKESVLQKLLNDSKQDFINGVTIKFNEIGESEIPSSYEKCNQFSLSIEKAQWAIGRHIALEEIKYY